MNQQEQDDSAARGVQTGAHEPGSKVNAEPRRQPIPEEAGQQNDGKALMGLKQCGQMHVALQPILLSLCGARIQTQKQSGCPSAAHHRRPAIPWGRWRWPKFVASSNLSLSRAGRPADVG